MPWGSLSKEGGREGNENSCGIAGVTVSVGRWEVRWWNWAEGDGVSLKCKDSIKSFEMRENRGGEDMSERG